MPLDSLPGTLTVKTRDEIVANYKRDYRLRDPNASLAEGEQPDIDARVFADQMMPIYDAALRAGNAQALENKFGDDLDIEWSPRGLPRQPASKATGFVQITASVGGGPIFDGDEIKNLETSVRYRCTETRLKWFDGDPVPIQAVDAGPQTDADPDTVLTWQLQRPGIGLEATVVEQSDGSGLSGGRDAETDEDYKTRIRDYQANPPAAGNDAEYQRAAEKTPGLSVQKAFTYPAIDGTGTSSLTCTMQPSRPGGNRKPTALERAAIEAHVVGKFPADDIAIISALTGQSQAVALSVAWSQEVVGWADNITWPPWYEEGGTPGTIVVQSATSPTIFILKTQDSDYTSVAQPVNGQTIAFYSLQDESFYKKRILSFTGTGPWTITCDTTNSASDVTYLPIVGQMACPWSESLNVLVSPLLEIFRGLGPGEQASLLYDAGDRLRRSPRSPREWPSVITTKALDDLFDRDEVQDGDVLVGQATTTVGTPGVLSYLLELGDFAIFQKIT